MARSCRRQTVAYGGHEAEVKFFFFFLSRDKKKKKNISHLMNINFNYRLEIEYKNEIDNFKEEIQNYQGEVDHLKQLLEANHCGSGDGHNHKLMEIVQQLQVSLCFRTIQIWPDLRAKDFRKL